VGQQHTAPEAQGPAPPPEPLLTISHLTVGGAPHLVLRGEVDHVTVGHLTAALAGPLERREPSVTVDLLGVEFLGVVGVRALVDAAARMAAHGGRLRVAASAWQRSRLFEGLGLHGRFDLVAAGGAGNDPEAP
jgi:anti-anti-sigma factor